VHLFPSFSFIILSWFRFADGMPCRYVYRFTSAYARQRHSAWACLLTKKTARVSAPLISLRSRAVCATTTAFCATIAAHGGSVCAHCENNAWHAFSAIRAEGRGKSRVSVTTDDRSSCWVPSPVRLPAVTFHFFLIWNRYHSPLLTSRHYVCAVEHRDTLGAASFYLSRLRSATSPRLHALIYTNSTCAKNSRAPSRYRTLRAHDAVPRWI